MILPKILIVVPYHFNFCICLQEFMALETAKHSISKNNCLIFKYCIK